MSCQYQLTPDAQTDLIKIRGYTLQQWGAEQSVKYLSQLKEAIQLLAESPFLGKSRPEISSDTFNFPYASHVIYYIVQQETIIVFAVLHKRMVPLKHLVHRTTKG